MKKLLVVDDDEAILEALRMALETFGYSVETLSRGDEVLKKAISFMPNLILLDYLLSGTDGIEILLALRKNRKTANIPVIIISAHPSAKKNALEKGADGFLAKPFDLDELANTIKKCIGV
jgi:DNA-binding response OmpR family regulator